MITINGDVLTPTIFPDMTSQVWKLRPPAVPFITIEWLWESEAEVMHIAQLLQLIGSENFKDYILSKDIPSINSFLQSHKIIVLLKIPYLPYARQDKQIANDSCFSLRTFLRILDTFSNNIRLTVESIDAHSEKPEEFAFYRSVYPTRHIENAISLLKEEYGTEPLLVFPDKGAYNRYSKFFPKLPSIFFEKDRDPLTGEIRSIERRNLNDISEEYSHVLVIDDICDGGRTFTSLVEHLPNVHRHLYVTHGIFSKGIDTLYNAGYDSVFVVNDLSLRTFSDLTWRKK